jgi:hypothetical protein
MLSVTLFRQQLLKVLCFSFFLSGLFFPVIISIKNIFLYTSLGLSLLLVPWETVLKQCKEEPFIASSLAFFTLIALGTIHSHAGHARAFAILAKYRCLLYPLFLIPLFKKYPSLCYFFIKGLFYSILLLLGITLVNVLNKVFYGKIPDYYPCFTYINPIYGSFVTALIGYLALVYTCYRQSSSLKQRSFYSIVFLGASCIILFFQQQRTGYFAYFFCMLCFVASLYPKLSFRYRLSLLLLCIPIVLLLPKIKTLSYRTEECLHNVLRYKYTQVIPFISSKQQHLLSDTGSLVARQKYLEFLRNEACLVPNKPLKAFENNLFMQSLVFKIKHNFFNLYPTKTTTKTITQKRIPLFHIGSTSIGERLGFWQRALPYIQKKPILGWGTGSFASLWVDEGLWYLYHTASFQSPSGIPNAHNQFLMILVEQGGAGLMLFFIWMFSFMICMFRKTWLSIGIACTGAFMIGCWGDSLLFLNVTGNFFLMLCSCLVSLPENHFKQTIEPSLLP